MIMLHYIRFCLSRLSLFFSDFEEASSHATRECMEEIKWQWMVRGPRELREASDCQPARDWSPESYYHKEINFATTWVSLEVDASPFGPSDENTIQLTLFIIVWWDLEVRTKFSQAWIPKPQNCESINVCGLSSQVWDSLLGTNRKSIKEPHLLLCLHCAATTQIGNPNP